MPWNPSKPHPGFTMIEVIIAMTIFVILATFGVTMISNVAKANRKVEMQEYLYTESQALIERMARTIQGSGIDYEEYYSRNVIGETDYGLNYGSYHQQFFNLSTTYETGAHPYQGSGKIENEANALCNAGAVCSTNTEYHQVQELYLINRVGNERTYFVVEEGSVAMVKLEGTDEDNNGIIDTWHCSEEFNCTETHPTIAAYSLPNMADLNDGFRDNDNFVPISPQHVTINDFQIYLSPIEDPYKGYNETDGTIFESVQIQPKVTIVVTAQYQLLDNEGNTVDFESSGDFIGQAPEVTLQTTIGTGVYNKLTTYTP